MRSTDEVHEDITEAYGRAATGMAEEELIRAYADLGRLWREMARTADRGPNRAPGWAVSAAAILADDNDRKARGDRKE